MDLKPSDPSASRPMRKMTADSCDEEAELPSLLRVEARRERISVCSEMCDGEAGEEEPDFHTMAGAAEARPPKRAAATLSSFMVVVCARASAWFSFQVWRGRNVGNVATWATVFCGKRRCLGAPARARASARQHFLGRLLQDFWPLSLLHHSQRSALTNHPPYRSAIGMKSDKE